MSTILGQKTSQKVLFKDSVKVPNGWGLNKKKVKLTVTVFADMIFSVS